MMQDRSRGQEWSLLDPRILDRVFFAVRDEVPGDLLDDDLQESVLERDSGSFRESIGSGPRFGKVALRVSIVDVVRIPWAGP